MRNLRILFIIFFALVLVKSTYSQNFRYGGGGGFTFLLSPSAYTDDIDSTGANYGFDSNFHLGGKIKAKLSDSPLSIFGKVLYTNLSGSKDNVVVTEGGEPIATDFSTSSSIFTVGAGMEYAFSPAPVSPYANLGLQLNVVGDRDFKRERTTQAIERTIEGGVRFGIGLGAGIDFRVLDQISIDTGLNFNFYNLFGQDTGEGTISSINLNIFVLYNPL